MTKIMLVEDDKSLREIYGVRLLAEGYDIVSAGDGEEALAMAIKERPQLIVSDVMMPKVSGYDMLDILRSTTETKNIRVIMMTALSSEEQRMRAESLGADRYLVKSQVGIEDVVRVVHEVLEDTPEAMAAAAKANSAPNPAPPAVPVTPTPQPAPIAMPAANATSLPAPGMPIPSAPTVPPVFATPSMPSPTVGPAPVKPQSSAPKPASLKTRIIQPLHDPSIAPVNINDLLDKELAKEAGFTGSENVVVESAEQEKASINEQLQSFVPPEPTPVEAPLNTQSAPVATPSPTLLPTPGVATSTVTPPIPVAAQPPTPASPSVVPSSPVPVAPTVPPRPAAAPVAVPPVPPAPQVPLTPVVNKPAVTPLHIAVVAPTSAPAPTPQTPTPPLPVAPTPTSTIPPAPVTTSSEPVVDLTKLPEVPKVS